MAAAASNQLIPSMEIVKSESQPKAAILQISYTNGTIKMVGISSLRIMHYHQWGARPSTHT